MKSFHDNDPLKKILMESAMTIKEISHPTKEAHSIAWAIPDYFDNVHLPTQGFKLHISANILNAVEIFTIVLPYLKKKKITFKSIASQELLRKMNEGRFGYSQVGKAITIYPKNTEYAVKLAQELDELLQNYEAPDVPSDNKLHNKSIVHYRYGIINGNRSKQDQRQYLITPSGEKIEDTRHPAHPVPDWVDNPFLKISKTSNDVENKSPLLLGRYLIIQTLRQRSKGGTYLAMDICKKNKTVKKVILREARKEGDLEFSGIDAFVRTKWYATLLQEMQPMRIAPEFYEMYESDNRLIFAMEYIDSENFINKALENEKTPKTTAVQWLIAAAHHIERLHEKELYLFDLSPDNILITPDGEVKLIDFEFFYKLNSDQTPIPDWSAGTPGFTPKVKLLESLHLPQTDWFLARDLYAFGATLFALFSSRWYHAIIDGLYPYELDWGQKQFRSDIPKQYLPIIDRCLLNTEPFRSVAELKIALGNINEN